MKNLILILISFVPITLTYAQIQVSPNGYVGVGPFYGNNSAYQLHVVGNAYISCIPASCGIFFQNNRNLYNGTWYNEPVILPQWGRSAWLGLANVPFWRAYSYEFWTENGLINYSDKRLKTNIKSFREGLNKISQMNPVSYDLLLDSLNLPPEKKINYDTNKLKKIGFLAQEMLNVCPEAVVYEETRKVYGIDYSVLIPVLVQAIKEQQIALSEQKAAIEELKKKVK